MTSQSSLKHPQIISTLKIFTLHDDHDIYSLTPQTNFLLLVRSLLVRGGHQRAQRFSESVSSFLYLNFYSYFKPWPPSSYKTCMLSSRNSERHESTGETAFWNVCFGTVLCERTCINNRVCISWNASDTRYLGWATNGPGSVHWRSVFLTVFCLPVAYTDSDYRPQCTETIPSLSLFYGPHSDALLWVCLVALLSPLGSHTLSGLCEGNFL